MRILAVEDDASTLAFLVPGLEDAGHDVVPAHDGLDGLRMAVANAYDALVIDRMLPAPDGLSLVRRSRAQAVRTPILFLTTMAGVSDRVDGLEAGGDDYLVKPFAFAELLARVHALGRRPPIRRVETVLRVSGPLRACRRRDHGRLSLAGRQGARTLNATSLAKAGPMRPELDQAS
jgi:two-component system OmpR family response regulator